MFKNHLKIAWRNLQKRKFFAVINILGLALGFGCSILIFLFVNHHLQFDNFHKNPERTFRFVTEQHRDDISYRASVPPGFPTAFTNDYDYAEKVAKIVSLENLQINGVDKNASKRFKEDVVFAETDFFEIFNFPTLEKLNGRDLKEPNTAYITESFSKRLFGNQSALGEEFALGNGEIVQVVGLLKDLPKNTFITGEIFASFSSAKSYNEFFTSETWNGMGGALQCFALLHPNQNIAQIEETIQELVTKHRADNSNVHHYILQPLENIHFNVNYGGINVSLLWIFGLIGLFLIAVACINFINISTAQAFTRSKEIGIRKVLGSFKKHLFWQFISETFILSVFALLMGVLMAVLALPYFNDLFELDLSLNSFLSLKVLGFVLLLLVTVSFFAGSYPGLILSRILPTLALKGQISQKDTGGKITRKILVTAQFVLSIFLIVATIVIARQISYAVNADLGFDKDAIVMLEIPEDVEPIKLQGLQERLGQLSGVKNSTACFASPGAAENGWGTNIRYDNRPEDEIFPISMKLADANYLKTFGLELIAGRNFYPSDTLTEVVVNQKLAQKLGLATPEELLGKKLEASGNRVSIVGVVADFHDQNFHETIAPVFIAPDPKSYNEIAVKIDGANAGNTLAGIQKLWEGVFPNHIYEHHFLDQRVAKQYAEEQRFLSMSKIFAGLAIFISCLGLYGMISFFVSQRKKEIGIRKVLGGRISDILVLFTQDFLKLIFIAGAIATPVAWYFMNNWLENYQYRIDIKWWFFILAISGIIVITLTTISYQAIRAATANPVKSLRTE